MQADYGNDFSSYAQSLEIDDPNGEFELTENNDELVLIITHQKSGGIITLPSFVLKDIDDQIFTIDNNRFEFKFHKTIQLHHVLCA